MGPLERRADLLDADRAKRGNPEPGVVRLRDSANRRLTMPVEHALKRRWRQKQGHVDLLTHDGRFHINGFDAGENIRDQIAALISLRIAPPGHFVVGRPVDIMKHRARQPLARERPKIFNIMAIAQAHRRTTSELGGTDATQRDSQQKRK